MFGDWAALAADSSGDDGAENASFTDWGHVAASCNEAETVGDMIVAVGGGGGGGADIEPVAPDGGADIEPVASDGGADIEPVALPKAEAKLLLDKVLELLHGAHLNQSHAFVLLISFTDVLWYTLFGKRFLVSDLLYSAPGSRPMVKVSFFKKNTCYVLFLSSQMFKTKHNVCGFMHLRAEKQNL